MLNEIELNLQKVTSRLTRLGSQYHGHLCHASFATLQP